MQLMLSFHFKIKKSFPYTLSPMQNPSKSKVYLSGYGVELAIKNQEYKAKDDTQVQGMIAVFILDVSII